MSMDYFWGYSGNKLELASKGLWEGGVWWGPFRGQTIIMNKYAVRHSAAGLSNGLLLAAGSLPATVFPTEAPSPTTTPAPGPGRALAFSGALLEGRRLEIQVLWTELPRPLRSITMGVALRLGVARWAAPA